MTKEWRVSDLRISGDSSDKVVLTNKLNALEADGWSVQSYQTVGDTWIIVSSRLR